MVIIASSIGVLSEIDIASWIDLGIATKNANAVKTLNKGDKCVQET